MIIIFCFGNNLLHDLHTVYINYLMTQWREKAFLFSISYLFPLESASELALYDKCANQEFDVVFQEYVHACITWEHLNKKK